MEGDGQGGCERCRHGAQPGDLAFCVPDLLLLDKFLLFNSFFLQESLCGASLLVSGAPLCLLPTCLFNLHTELGNHLPLILPSLVLGSHPCIPKKCSYIILLGTGITVWGSVPPYMIAPYVWNCHCQILPEK